MKSLFSLIGYNVIVLTCISVCHPALAMAPAQCQNVLNMCCSVILVVVFPKFCYNFFEENMFINI